MSFSANHSILLALSLVAVVAAYAKRPRKLPLPPGPPALPIVGNIGRVPVENAWLRFTELMEQFGDMTMFHGLGNHILVLNTAEGMEELFEKRHTTYSDRPRLVMLGDLMGANRLFLMKSYGKEWKDHRKIARVALSNDVIPQYHSLMEETALVLCKNISRAQENFFDHIRVAAGRTLLSTIYGVEVESVDNRFIAGLENALRLLTAHGVPGKHLCDLFPWMVYLPSWLPFQRLGQTGRKSLDRVMYEPYYYVKQQVAAGTALASVTQRLVEEYQDTMTQTWEDAIVGCMAGISQGGFESSIGTMLVFILAMALYPEKQAKAQAELDSVVGTQRLPSIADADQLPYVNALIKEVLRWHPVVPLGMVRSLKEEDTYAGYRLPKGTMIIPNVWALSRKPNSKYPPEDFIPERFLDPSHPTLDPATWAFGFGRRICPGKLFAERSLFALMSHILASFRIEQLPDQPIVPSFKATGLTSFPNPFACSFQPRRSIRNSRCQRS